MSYFNIPELKNRGWIRSMIAKFLGKPDQTAQNSHFHNAPHIKQKRRVLSLEEKPDFQTLLLGQAKRSKKGKQDTLANVSTIAIEIYAPASLKEVMQLAIASKEEYEHYVLQDFDFDGESASDADKIHWTVNYLLHECTDYDFYLFQLKDTAGITEARRLLKIGYLTLLQGNIHHSP